MVSGERDDHHIDKISSSSDEPFI